MRVTLKGFLSVLASSATLASFAPSAAAEGPVPAPTGPVSTPGAAADPAPPPIVAPTPTPVAQGEGRTAPADGPVYERSVLDLGLKVGGAFSGVFNSLGGSFTPELEVGALLPFADRALEVFLNGRWAAPSDQGESPADPRLPGDGVASWEVTRHELSLGLGLRLRIPIPSELFRPYVAAGARVFFIDTEVSGSADGQSFGTNDETGTYWGFLFQAGGELYVGPGALLLELAINGAPVDRTVLADTNASSFDVYLGYRLFF